MRRLHAWIRFGFAVGSATFMASGLTTAAVDASEPILDWASVREVCRAAEQGPQIGGGTATAHAPLDLQRFDSALPAPPVKFAERSAEQPAGIIGSDGGPMTRSLVSPALMGLSSSIVPAVTGDLVPVRQQVAVRSVSTSFGQVAGLRLYGPKVGVSVGASSPDFVGVK